MKRHRQTRPIAALVGEQSLLARRDGEAIAGTTGTARGLYWAACHGKRDRLYDGRRGLAMPRAVAEQWTRRQTVSAVYRRFEMVSPATGVTSDRVVNAGTIDLAMRFTADATSR